MSSTRYFVLGAATTFLGAVMAISGLSCGVFTQQRVATGIDQAAHICVTVATMACRPDVALLCKTAHDVNALITPVLQDIAAGKVACVVVDAGAE